MSMSKAAVLQHYNASPGVHAKKTSTALLFLGVFQLDKKSDGDRGARFSEVLEYTNGLSLQVSPSEIKI